MLGLTVAVNVTAVPNGPEVGLAVKAVLVDTPFTVCETAFEVLPVNAGLPRYLAVMLSVPAGSPAKFNTAAPELFTFTPVMIAEPSKNCTVPVVGVPPEEVTVAVMVTV
jgi:hypothetical protein